MVIECRQAFSRISEVMRIILIILWILISSTTCFEATWKSVDSRETPAWYDKAKVGVLVHFGIHLATIGSEWCWMALQQGMPDLVEFMELTRPPNFTYRDFVSEFKAEFFDAQEWGDLSKEASAKYVILTVKHHGGITLYPCSYSFNWNSIDDGASWVNLQIPLNGQTPQ
jgi:alpha-L-fucosidase